MKPVKNLHILFPEKFFLDFIPFVNSNFNPEEHLFLYLKTDGKEPKAGNVMSLKYYRWGLLFYWELFQYARKSDKIILHSLSKSKVISFLFLFSSFRKKAYWYLWGGDLYYRIEKYSTSIFNPFSKWIFKSVVKNLGAIVSQVKGDVDLARSWFGFSGKHIDCFLYPSNLFKPLALSPKKVKTLFIQLGNSAHPSNKHIEAIDRIAYLKNDDVKILCPLSYGGKKNAQKVIEYGKNVFGEKFVPLTNFMPLQEYIDFLSTIDIAIFNHWRQQGLGNIISLLGLGKAVYLRDDITTWRMLVDKKIQGSKFNDDEPLRVLTADEAASNKEQVQLHFSLEVLIQQSANVFA